MFVVIQICNCLLTFGVLVGRYSLLFFIIDLTKKQRSTIYTVFYRFGTMGNFLLQVALNMFDALDKPILAYNANGSMMDQLRSLERNVV